MKPGDKVTIYQKPLTGKHFEGRAVLVRYLGIMFTYTDGTICERWLVRFENERDEYERNILIYRDSDQPVFTRLN